MAHLPGTAHLRDALTVAPQVPHVMRAVSQLWRCFEGEIATTRRTAVLGEERCGTVMTTLLRPVAVSLAQTGLPRVDDRLGSVRDGELAKDAGDVVADRLGADDQALGDLGIAAPLGDQFEHIIFPVGELTEDRPRGRGGLRRTWSDEAPDLGQEVLPGRLGLEQDVIF